MNIAQTYSTPPRDPEPDDRDNWPVLARIPDLSTEARPQPSEHAPAPARPTARRFDRPQTRTAGAIAPSRAAAVRPDIGTHSAHTAQPPAHHLYQRATRGKKLSSDAPSESSVLPNWNPFSIPGKRLPDAFAHVLSFLAMVVLFTAAGTSILILRNRPKPPVSEPPPQARIEQAAAAEAPPTAVGPLGASATRLLPAFSDESATAALPALPAPQLVPSTDVDATDNALPDIDTTPATNAPTAEKERSTIEYPEPVFPPTIEINLPQAAVTDTRLPIARFTGEILESPTRQARHDDQSSIH